MSRPRSPDLKPPAEPDTESRRALLRWLGAVHASRLAFLARASGVDEQTLLAFVERHARPAPDSEAARLVAIATRGDVPSHGWRTEEEFEACRGARARAMHLAHASDAPRTPRPRVPASRPVAARRRPRGAPSPQSARPASSGLIPSPASPRESLLEPPRLKLLLGRHEPPASTERSDPPTQPSTPIRPRPSQTTTSAPAVEVVEPRPHGGHRDVGRHRTGGSPPSSGRSATAVALAEAIATLIQQGYSIRLERKE